MKRSAVIIYNPRSGRRRGRNVAISKMVGTLERRGLRVEARATAAPGDATRLSREARDAGVDIIIAHGGDGTIKRIANISPPGGAVGPFVVPLTVT